MWRFESSAETTGDPAIVWQAWEDAAHWNQWQPMIEESGLQGPFSTGTEGYVDPVKGSKAKFTLTDVQPGKHWASRAKMPGGNLDFVYDLTPTATGTRITMGAEIGGFMGPIYALMIGRLCKQGIPEAVKNLKARAEGTSVPA